MTVRDFIYIDGDRLYSLYSQVFEGVAERIVQTYIDELSSANTQKSSPLSGESAETKVAEASRRTENRLLYDHMYSQLETKLASAITEPVDLSQDSYADMLANTFMVKVRGAAEIDDYRRLQVIIENFNTLGQIIAYPSIMLSGLLEPEGQQPLAGNKKDRHKQTRPAQQTHQQKIKELATAMGLQQDEQVLQNLKTLGELFNPDGFEVTITPEAETNGIVFRGVLDKQWLRTRPEFLRSMYGIKPVASWTLVGQVTHIPGLSTSKEVQTSLAVETETDEENPSMRDPFRAMFSSSGAFEKMFLESRQRTEIVVAPLALYREYSLEDTSVASSSK
jgi:hypothetical protein